MTTKEFRRIRKQVARITQAKLGFEIGVTVTTINNWERGKNPIPPYIAQLLQLKYCKEADGSPEMK